MSDYKFETLAVHAGQVPDPTTLSRGVSLHKTTAYQFNNAQHAADLFNLTADGYIYSRLGHPTNALLEARLAALEGGAASVTVATGTSAIHYAIITLAKEGDEIVSAKNLYGGTYTMFSAIFPTFGLTVRFVDPRDPENFRKAITKKTKALFVETIGNPALDFADIEAIATIAHEAGIPLIVDATFTTPYLLQAGKHGADIIVHSLTKWIGGHGAAMGGSVTDMGAFDWNNERFPLFNEPDANYHGLRFARDLPKDVQKRAFALRLRLVPLRNLGAALDAEAAWHFILGLESLPVRMARHSENAQKVAEYLSAHKKVAWVRYPGLTNDPSHDVARRYLTKGYGGVAVFGLKSGYDGAVKLINEISLFSNVANVGDAKSLITHSASTTHSQLSAEERDAAGVYSDLLRLSIGLEHIDDIIDALDRAIAKA